MNEQPRIEQFGRAEWPRYRIVQGRCFWAENGWSNDSSEAVVFADMKQAVPVWQAVVQQQSGDDMLEHRLTVVGHITIRSKGYNLHELAAWLAVNTHIHLDMEPPPLPDVAIIDMRFDWTSLEQKDNPSIE